MNVLFVNEKLGWFGGVEQNIADTVEGLRGRGVRCFLAYAERTNRDPEKYAELFEGTAPCGDFPGAEGKPLAEIARAFGADTIYYHKIRTLPRVEGFRAVRMIHDHDLCCPRKHKYFVHNAAVCEHPAGWRCYLDLAWLQRDRGAPGGVKLLNLEAHRAEMRRNHALDLCLVGSQFMRRELEMNGFPAKRTAILPPVVRMAGPELTDTAAEPHVLFVGQLIRGKGVDQLLRALALVKVDYRATIIGEGNARPGLEALAAELGLNDRVKFLGWVANKDLGSHYAGTRLLAVPARWPEPFGMIGLEAMHHGRPIVGFRVGGIPDWLEHEKNGLLAEQTDIAAYAELLTRLLVDRDFATRLGRAGLERVRTEFSFDSYLDRLVGHLEGGPR